MALEIIGTSAFGVGFDTDRAGSRIVQEARFINDPAQQPLTSINRIGIILVPQLARLWYLLSSWAGVPSVRGSCRARGFLLGTGQALIQNARHQMDTIAGAPSAGATGAAAADGTAGDAQSRDAAPQAAASAAPASKISWAALDIFSQLDPCLGIYQQAKADALREHGAAVPRPDSLLHHLLRARNRETRQPFSEVEIMAQSGTFLVAGFETVATALTFAIIGLSQNLEAEAALLAEVDAFAWKGDAGIALDDIKNFPYTRAVIDETMRMWPPVTPALGLQREATADTSIGSHKVSKGERIWIDVEGIHHDSRFWPQPEAFRPERFLDGSPEAKSRHPNAYLPFGVGPRKCIGWRFALEEAVIALAQLYRLVTFRLDPEKHPEGQPLDVASGGATISVRGGAWALPLPR